MPLEKKKGEKATKRKKTQSKAKQSKENHPFQRKGKEERKQKLHQS
jgi:hypothetical protein